MPAQTVICLVIFVLTIASYILNKIPMAMTSLVAMFAMIVTGCVDADAALSNFANSNAIIMASFFIIAAGLNRTQMVKKVTNLVYKISGGSFTKGLAGYCLVTFLVAQVIPSAVVIFSICFPLVLNFCERMNVNTSKAMFSIGIVSISCVAQLPVGAGSATYIPTNGLLDAYGLPQYQFDIFTFFAAKWPMLLIVMLYAIFVAPKLAPDKAGDLAIHGRTMKEPEPLKPFQEFCGYGIFLAVVICIMFADYLPLTTWQICLAGALLVVVTGVLSEREAVDSMNLPVVFLFVGGLTMGQALVNTGAGDVIGNAIVGILSDHPNNYVVGLVFFLIPFALTQVMVNNSVIQSIQPIVILTCASLGYNPIGPLVLAITGAQVAYMTPMATPTVPLMMGLGGYTQKDMFKMSWLPAILFGTAAVFWTMTVFPCY